MITDSGDHDHPSVAKFRPVRFFLEKGELKTAIDETVTRDSTTQTRTETATGPSPEPAESVSEYVRRAARAGLEWPLPEELDEAALEARLFSSAGPGSRERVVPDVERIHQELKRVGVTLHLLWEEYREANPKICLSQFCVIPVGPETEALDAANLHRLRQTTGSATTKPVELFGRQRFLRRSDTEPETRRLDRRTYSQHRAGSGFPINSRVPSCRYEA